MKKSILVLLATCFLGCHAFAQNESAFSLRTDSTTGKFTYTRIVEVEGASAGDLLKRAVSFTKTSKGKFFASNGSRNLGMEIMGTPKANDAYTVNTAKASAGYDSHDPETNEVLAHFTWRYEGSAYNSPRLLLVTGDAIIRTKDGRARIELSNMAYEHYNIATGRQQQLFGWSDKGPCSSHGPLEQLRECNQGDGGMRKASKFFNEEGKKILLAFDEYMRAPAQSKDDW